jgi:hypothetical protein
MGVKRHTAVEHIMSKLVCVVFHAIVLKRKENTHILIK